MRNKYEDICYFCGKTVLKGRGHFERIKFGTINNKKWRTIHSECVYKQRQLNKKTESIKYD